MKPAILIMGAVACFLTFTSCDSATDKTADDKMASTTDTATSVQQGSNTNFCLDESTGKAMIAEFEKTFRTVEGRIQSAITPNIFIKTDAMIAINQYLKANKCDGFRIYLGASDKDDFPGETRKSKIIFIGVPTINGNFHPDVWRSKILVKGGSELETNMDTTTSFAAIRKFKKIYRGEGSGNEMKNFSKAIWIHGTLIDSMAKLLTDHADSLSGFKLFAGAYSNINPNVPSQEYSIQSTILLVPINKADGSENWTIFKHCNITDKASILDAANHGELCPKNCPPTEP